VGHHRDRLQPAAGARRQGGLLGVDVRAGRRHGRHVSLLRKVTDLIGSVLIYLGKSPNSSKDADLAEVVRLLRSIKPRLKKFSSDTCIDELAAGETWLAQGWSGDVFQSQDQNPT
jgi:spermidine/putrescine-binding protein